MEITLVRVSVLVLCVLFRHASANSVLNLDSGFSLLRTDAPAETLELPVGTCNANTPCVNGACCSGGPKGSGLCGYSPSECGAANCTSNCDAKAECGQYGAPGRQKCPLNVCCSKFGFCGSTESFCSVKEGCQKGFGSCGDVKRPQCSSSGGSVGARSIGYYESWANTRPCGVVTPEDLNLDGLTHVNFAFVFFDANTFQIIPMDKNAGSLLDRFTRLKERKPGLQTWVSVGGWSFNDPGPFQLAFSNMASTAQNRKTFVDNIIKFMDTYGFDGMDLDWEYPTADDRGGRPDDSKNFVALSKDIKNAFAGRYGYSITLPASYWYLQHFDLPGHQPSVDWFNLMSYDLHGVWDGASKFVGPYIAPHTNISEIDQGLDLLWRAGVKPEKLVMGLGYYGRSFTLKDPACGKPDGKCQFSGGARAGPCSGASGILNLREILDIIKQKNLKPVHDKAAGVKWIRWDNDQWVSYDDDETFDQKREFANSRCLGGLMVWALDQVDQKAKSLLQPSDLTQQEIDDAEAVYQDEAARGVCYTTKCNKPCSKGDHEASRMKGQPGQLSLYDRCPSGEFRRLCCGKGAVMGVCKWRGYRGLGLTCTGGCKDGEKEITQNTNHVSEDGREDQSCTGGTQSFCCAGFKPPITKDQVVDSAVDTIKDEAKQAAIDLAESAALELAATAFCRIAITAALTPLTFIPFIGWIVRLAVQAAVPALSKLCAKGIAKGGKSVFKFRGKDYEVKLDKPLSTKTSRPPASRTTDPPTKQCSRRALAARADPRGKTITETKWVNPPREVRVPKVCRGGDWPQACLHYSSVIDRDPSLKTLTCVNKLGNYERRPRVRLYNSQHDKGWILGWMQEANLNCERDEYPPADVWQARDNRVWIRLSPKKGNGGAGNLFKGCPDVEASEQIAKPAFDRVLPGCKVTVYTEKRRVIQTALVLEFNNMPDLDDYGIEENKCWPKELVDDPGFAFLRTDPWYRRNRARGKFKALYQNPPTDQFTRGKTNRPGWNKRGIDGIAAANSTEDMGTDIYDDADDSALQQHHGLIDNGVGELNALDLDMFEYEEPWNALPAEVDAVPTQTTPPGPLRTTVARVMASVLAPAGSLSDSTPTSSAAPSYQSLDTL